MDDSQIETIEESQLRTIKAQAEHVKKLEEEIRRMKLQAWLSSSGGSGGLTDTGPAAAVLITLLSWTIADALGGWQWWALTAGCAIITFLEINIWAIDRYLSRKRRSRR
jgi:hypothetical protein